jgi:hypothetical protein
LRGFSRQLRRTLRQSSRKLQIGPAVQSAEAFEAALADPLGPQLAAGVPELGLDALDDQIQVPWIDVALVGRPDQTGAELLAVERQPRPVALDHLEDVRNGAFIGGEAVAALRAAPPAADGVALGPAGLEDGGGGVAARTVHFTKCTYH